MGRAIDMENDISKLKLKFERLENTIRGMSSKLDEIKDKSSKTKHIDLTEVKNDKKETKKSNNEASNHDNKQDADNTRASSSKSK